MISQRLLKRSSIIKLGNSRLGYVGCDSALTMKGKTQENENVISERDFECCCGYAF